MKPSAFASAHHEYLFDEWMELEDKNQVALGGAADIGVVAKVEGSHSAVGLVFAVGVGVLQHSFANSCRYIAESIGNKNQFDTFGQYSCFTLAWPLASGMRPPQHSCPTYLCNSPECG